LVQGEESLDRENSLGTEHKTPESLRKWLEIGERQERRELAYPRESALSAVFLFLTFLFESQSSDI
jgi:hypothetical protein